MEIGLKINHGKNSNGRFVSAPKIKNMEKIHCKALATAIITSRQRSVRVSGSKDLSVISTSSCGFSAYAAQRIINMKDKMLCITPIIIVPVFKLMPQQKSGKSTTILMLYKIKQSELFEKIKRTDETALHLVAQDKCRTLRHQTESR